MEAVYSRNRTNKLYGAMQIYIASYLFIWYVLYKFRKTIRTMEATEA